MIDQRIKIGITQGDTNGVGWELILKIFADSRMCEICTPVIYGSRSVADYYKKNIADLEECNLFIVPSSREAKRGKVNFVECGDKSIEVTPGVASEAAGKAAVDSLVRATQELKAGVLDALVTAPFNKESVQSDAFNYTGHTEFFAAQSTGHAMMMMCSENLKVGLVTKHVPIAQVGVTITQAMIEQDLTQLRLSLRRDFSIVEPRIAVLSLNPHAGDGGLIGDEEKSIISPAIKAAYDSGVMAFGPYAADGFFANGTYRKYDAVLAMYHDQGLIPFKTIAFDGVNYTAGLAVVRTSPDHGVAYDIAGKGIADAASMRNAIYMAIDIVRSRETNREIESNPLQHAEREKSHRDISVADMKNIEKDPA